MPGGKADEVMQNWINGLHVLLLTPEIQAAHQYLVKSLSMEQNMGGEAPPGADATIQQTLEYLEEHGMVNPSHSEYAAPVVSVLGAESHQTKGRGERVLA